MKKQRITLTLFTLLGATLFFTACATTPKTSSAEITEEISEKTIREPKPITVQNTSNQKEKNFKELLNSFELKVVSKPNPKRIVYTGMQFKEPYVISVTNEDGPVSNFDITVSWPTSRTNNTIIYNSINIKTDENGKISFLPEASNIAVKDKISFYPTPISSSPSIIQAAFSAGIELPFVIRSNFVTYPGGILFVYDFNEKGTPGTNNFSLLQILRNEGINAGNAPISDTSYFNKPLQELYQECKDIVEDAANFMIFGSFKYAEPAKETEIGISCTITADITCINMKDGSTLYKTVITDTATDKTKWNAEQKCRSTLAEKVADEIIYGM